MTTRPRTVLVMAPATFDQLFGTQELDRLRELARVADPVCVTCFEELTPAVLAEVEVLITGWGCGQVPQSVLAAAPHLRLVLHAAGSARDLLPTGGLRPGIQVATAAEANAVPVAEYTLAAIIFAGKRALPLAQQGRTTPAGWASAFAAGALSNRGRTIGIVGFSKIGRRVLELLRVLETGPVLVADPTAQADQVRQAGGELRPLPEVLARSEICSLHAPLLPSTRGMIGAVELALLPDGATLINTARGGILDHDALARECAAGRLDAILDVTEPEPLPRGHRLLDLPNVTITPHVAGSLGSETRRLSAFVLDALAAHLDSRPLPGALTAESVGVSA